MKVLVTGGAGFAGSHLIEHFIKKTNWEIISMDSYRHKGDDLRHVTEKRVSYISHDCSTPIGQRLAKKIGHVDYIINLAAESHVDRSIDDPCSFIENNTKIALFMAEYARTISGLKAFVQVSTDEVYGAAPDGIDHKEWSPILPSNPYSASKASQEAVVIGHWRTYGLPLIITNTMNMIGERQDEEKFIPLVIKKLINDEVISVHGTPEYIGRRKYLHARNHADAILFILKNTQPTIYIDNDEVIFPDRYNVVGDVELNNMEVVMMISEILGRPAKTALVDFHSARPGHDRRYSLDGSKLKSLGWTPPTPFRESLEKMVEWTLSHKEWI